MPSAWICICTADAYAPEAYAAGDALHIVQKTGSND